MNLIIRLIINAIAFYLIAMYVPGIHANSFTAALIAAIIFGIVNAIIRPLLLLITLPLTVITLGLFIIVVNALMFWLTAAIAPGFHVYGFVPALEGAIIMMIVSFIVSHLFKSEVRR
ncbi:MAG: phage holin family protein [Candidatus Eremiobacteraeota bacterium]|nr:phage holin family protein [Candidatus Eremiobacteraeota bacterium]